MSNAIIGVDVSKLDLSISLLIDKIYHQTKIDNNQEGYICHSSAIVGHRIVSHNGPLSC